MNARICMEIPAVASVNVKIINGHKKYSLDGIGSRVLNEFIDFTDHLFINRSYYITSRVDICLQSLKHNESDFTSQLSFYGENSDSNILVPVPVIPMKTSMLSGYDLNTITSRDRATALSNFGRYEIPVFVYLFFLIISFTLAIGAKVFISSYRRNSIRMMNNTSKRNPHEFRVFWRKQQEQYHRQITLSKLINYTWKGFVSVITGSMTTFKWVNFLFALLCLFMISSYYGSFSTSSIIPEKRFVIKTYEQLINHPKALIFFYDQQSDTASLFRRSHRNTLKGRIWRKLIQQSNSKLNKFIIKSLDESFLPMLMNVFTKMQQLNSVVIATTYSNRIFSWLLCGCSPEDELWRMIDYVDPSEKEKLEGWSVSAHCYWIDYFTYKFRRLVDSGLIYSLIGRGVVTGLEVSADIAGTSLHHRLEQSRACIRESTSRHPSTITKNIGYHYYLSTLLLCLGQLTFAFIVLGVENVISFYLKKRKKKLSRARVNKRIRRRRRPPPFRPTISS